MSSSSKVIVLKSSDGETFEVEEAVALESQTIKHMIEDDCADTVIPLPNVTSKILSKVIEYCKKHVETPKTEEKATEDDLKSFDAEFIKVDQGTLFDLILAANYLNIKSLLDLTCQTRKKRRFAGRTLGRSSKIKKLQTSLMWSLFEFYCFYSVGLNFLLTTCFDVIKIVLNHTQKYVGFMVL
ncbi:hypothetical protein L1987_32198 [Smallanthus sonchifolius]|uniref:Uncharacterized protein n=1 Tax=Smallanthus sonchifolius TaxID=185202 RepID=A0ACB9I7R5_9ASTR|nr:hypothetical protein L1987_32198 [Smallanthus sonchifolius]